MSGLSETFSRLAFLEKRSEELTAERAEAEASKARTIENLWVEYREAKLELLKRALQNERDWLATRRWSATDESGRSLDNERGIGTGICIFGEGYGKCIRDCPAICIDLPYYQPMYRVFLANSEEETLSQVFFVEEVVSRIAELMLECDRSMKGKPDEGIGDYPVDRK